MTITTVGIIDAIRSAAKKTDTQAEHDCLEKIARRIESLMSDNNAMQVSIDGIRRTLGIPDDTTVLAGVISAFGQLQADLQESRDLANRLRRTAKELGEENHALRNPASTEKITVQLEALKYTRAEPSGWTCKTLAHGRVTDDVAESWNGAIDAAILTITDWDALCQMSPDGWKWVPVEPTEEMVINGFESEPDKFFSSDDEWESYASMSGCEQAAHRARLCYSAMLAAAPQPDHSVDTTENATTDTDHADHRLELAEIPVERNENGYWSHPTWSALFSGLERMPRAKLESFLKSKSLEYTYIELEYDSDNQDAAVHYFVNGSCDVSAWKPTRPNGDGWFIVSIHETEDGPVCFWVRPIPHIEGGDA